MRKLYALSKEQLEALPSDVQTKVLNTLKAYDECSVVFEYGEYHVSTGHCLKAVYADDRKFIGTFYAEDIYTLEERTENYIESFRDYPIWYKGPRDYLALKARFGN